MISCWSMNQHVGLKKERWERNSLQPPRTMRLNWTDFSGHCSNDLVEMSRHRQLLSPTANLLSRISSSLLISSLVYRFIIPNSLIALAILLFLLMASSKVFDPRRILASWLAPSISPSKKLRIRSIKALDCYESKALKSIGRRYSLFMKLPLSHRNLASRVGYLDRLDKLQAAVKQNAIFIQQISQHAKTTLNLSPYELMAVDPLPHYQVIELIGHFVRDWSIENTGPRTVLLKPLMEALSQEFGHLNKNKDSKPPPKVLVPGSGLARAAYEIAELGFQTEAIEFSSLMDLTTTFWLQDSPPKASQYTIHPFCHEFSHQRTQQDQLRICPIPDIRVKRLPNLNLKYGDFNTLKSLEPECFDAIVSLYFVDTAENVIQYLQRIRQLLKPGGIWINYGPLKWGSAPQVEFTMEELKSTIKMLGFHIEQEFSGKNEYTGDANSLWQGMYILQGWIARKSPIAQQAT